jgi:acetyltransferase-like isoleucine patch superfamily enzyme
MRAGVIFRIGVTVSAIAIVETIVCGLAAAPIAGCWWWLTRWAATAPSAFRIAVLGMAAVPSYAAFALCLMAWSALLARLTGARTPAHVSMRIADFDWRLMTWVRYMAAIHVVRVLAGTFFRGTPLWTTYLRLNGARIGRRVYVNTTAISDHNLLDVGDDVVIGADVHLSGHTVERGFVTTAPVRIGSNVTLGLGCAVDIDVEIGDHTQVGALSFVPKHSRLSARTIYVGIPVKPLKQPPVHGARLRGRSSRPH